MWFETLRGVVHPWHCDRFGHMNVRWYLPPFDDAGFHLWTRIGFSYDRMVDLGVHTVVASTKIDYLKELRDSDLFVIRSAFTRLGTKSATYTQKMFQPETGVHHATNEAVEVFFDPETRKAAPMPDEVRKLIEDHIADPDKP